MVAFVVLHLGVPETVWQCQRGAALLAIYSEPLLAGRRLWIFLAVLVSAAIAWYLWQKRTDSWPLTHARIESVNVSAVRSLNRDAIGTREICTAEICYSYSVAGEFYSGYWTQYFSDEQEAWDSVGPLKGREVSVHYDPRHPEHSVFASE
jgi:hypothetical protein